MHISISSERIFIAKETLMKLILENKYTHIAFYSSSENVVGIKFLKSRKPNAFKIYLPTSKNGETLLRAYLAPKKFLDSVKLSYGKYLLMHLDEDFYAVLLPGEKVNPYKITFIPYVKSRATEISDELFFRVLPSKRFVLCSNLSFVENRFRVKLSKSSLELDNSSGSKVSSINKADIRKASRQLMGRVPKNAEVPPGKYVLKKVTDTKYSVVSIGV